MSSQHPSRKHIIRKAILELLSDEYRNYLDANCANDIWRVSLALVHPAEDRDLFTHTSSWQPPSAATSLSTAASLEQLLIKCLAQGHPKVIGSPSSQHICIHAFKIGHFCNTASECQIGYLRPQELKRCKDVLLLLCTQHVGSSLISIRWMCCTDKGDVLKMKTKTKKRPHVFSFELEGLELNCVFCLIVLFSFSNSE